jgi:hypothetical protein
MEIKAALVVVAFKRHETLKSILEAVSEALVSEYQEIVFVQQGSDQEVSTLIENFDSLPSRHLQFDRKEAKTPEQAINANVREGISAAFQNSEINLVTVLEDDIRIGQDCLKFNVDICKAHYSDPAFRGINGFSGLPRTSNNQFTYSKQRFGLGWGWSITDQTWDEMRKFWLGTENFHWDGLVESFCKSGYVIMPSQSRVLNLGFGKDATHTSDSDEVKVIESRLKRSFVDRYSNISAFIEVNERQYWRSDCLPYFGNKTIKGKTVQMVYDLQVLLRIKPGDSKLVVKAKAKILGILQRAIETLL